MVKRLFDIVFSSLALCLLAPVFVAAYLSVRLTSPGPAIFCAHRAGLCGKVFLMYKFRTMHLTDGPKITATNDRRIFTAGKILRLLKIDELPQLLNVVKGDMSIVGPRPEDPAIVNSHYAETHKQTLTVRPGLASPGSLYVYTHGHLFLGTEDPERDYIANLLPTRLALEMVYIKNMDMFYDIIIIIRTISTLAQIALGRRQFPEPPELKASQSYYSPARL